MFISTTASIYLADTRTTRKFVYLPAASTAQGRAITIKDYYGNAFLSSFTISTLGLDRIDTYSNAITLSNDFQSVELIGAGPTNWSLVNNYTGGLVAAQRSSLLLGIPNLSLWLDPTDASTMTFSAGNSTDVLSWGDKSSNAYSFVPVNSNIRSQRSTNCIVINQSTSHYLSQQNIPGTQQSDFFCVVLDRSLRGPLTGIVQNADMMFLETDGRYHSQFFADGQETFTTLATNGITQGFFIYQGSLYHVSENNGAINRFQSGAFALISTATTTVSLRGGAVYEGRVYIPFNGGINVMNPNVTLQRIAPAFTSNFIGTAVWNNEIYFGNATTTFAAFKYTPYGTTLTNVGNTGTQNVGRMIVYNGGLYMVGESTGTFLQLYNGGNVWASVFGQNFTLSRLFMVFSNTLVYGQANTQRIIEWRQETGSLFLGSNNLTASAANLSVINYRGRIWTPTSANNANTYSQFLFSGKNRGTQGSSEFIQVNTQTFTTQPIGAVVYDGSLFIGSQSAANVLRYGNGTTVDTNVSSINAVVAGAPRIVMLRKNQTNCGLWVNGTELSNRNVSFTYNNLSPQQTYIGGMAGTILTYNSDPGRDHFEGALYEVLNYTSTLTTDNRQRIEGYLAWKYGIQTYLPVGHPFINSPPT